MHFKLGVVPYLNALPLYWTLRDRPDIEIVREVPSKLEGLLERGAVDAALLPVVDHLRGVGDGLLGDAIIGTTGKVRSVLLFSRRELTEIQSVAADTSSHSSVALSKILLGELYGCAPQFLDEAPDLKAMLEKHHAALLIGDPALEAAQKPENGPFFDLAALWDHLTGLPFVFAAWTARKGLENRAELEISLNQARDAGTKQIAAIVAQNPTQSCLKPEIIESYLREAIQFRMTTAHHAGMEEFRRRLASQPTTNSPDHFIS